MLRKVFWVLAACIWLAVPAAAQMENDLLDVFTVKVKQDKGAQFEAVAKKIVAANRQNNGSNWLALSQVYGSGTVFRFVSTPPNFAAIEKSNEMFMAALSKTYGETAAAQILRDGDACMESAQSEVRRRRWDLSANAPADAAAASKLIGGSRWIQTVMVRVRPGHGPHFEEVIRAVKEANEKSSAKVTTLVSQAISGQTGTVYYISTPRKSLAEIDSAIPLPQLLGQEAYAKFQKDIAESVMNTESTISRFAPEFSNPAEEIIAAAPEFWRPKAAKKAVVAKQTE